MCFLTKGKGEDFPLILGFAFLDSYSFSASVIGEESCQRAAILLATRLFLPGRSFFFVILERSREIMATPHPTADKQKRRRGLVVVEEGG
jgi:hypothetical protein